MHIEHLHVGMEVAGHEDGSTKTPRVPVSATSHLSESECCAFHCFFTRPFSQQAWFISSVQLCGKSWLSGSLGPPGLAFDEDMFQSSQATRLLTARQVAIRFMGMGGLTPWLSLVCQANRLGCVTTYHTVSLGRETKLQKLMPSTIVPPK